MPKLPLGTGTAPCFSKEAIFSRSAFARVLVGSTGVTCVVCGSGVVLRCSRAAIRSLRLTGGTGGRADVLKRVMVTRSEYTNLNYNNQSRVDVHLDLAFQKD